MTNSTEKTRNDTRKKWYVIVCAVPQPNMALFQDFILQSFVLGLQLKPLQAAYKAKGAAAEAKDDSDDDGSDEDPDSSDDDSSDDDSD